MCETPVPVVIAWLLTGLVTGLFIMGALMALGSEVSSKEGEEDG